MQSLDQHQMQQPRHIIVGGGSRRRVGALAADLGITRVLIVTDAHFIDAPLCDEIEALLEAVGIASERHACPLQEPESEALAPGVAAARRADGIVALGGGTPIDSAKAIAVLAAHGGHIRDYRVPREVALPRMPIIAVPTTAGTGSEATRFTVITDSDNGEKMLCRGTAFLPDAAIVDFETTLTMPERLIADTGIDAFTHALEAWVSRLANPWSDLLATEAMRLIAGSLETAYRTPRETAARATMMRAATLAGLAFSNASVALVHGMSRPIGGLFHVPHGLSNAMLLPDVTRFSTTGASQRYAQAARICGFAPADSDDESACTLLVDALETLNERLAVPGPAAWGIDRAAWFDAIPAMARMAQDSGSPQNNPRVPTLAEMETIYSRLWGN